VYEPIPWRTPNYLPSAQQTPQPEQQQQQQQRRDTVTALIDSYRREKYEPALGHEDHFAFKEETEVEEWPAGLMVDEWPHTKLTDEVLALHRKNHAARTTTELADQAGRARMRGAASWSSALRLETAPGSRRGSASARHREHAPAERQRFEPGERRSFWPDARRASSAYSARPSAEAGPGKPQGRKRRASARMNADELAQEYRRIIGEAHPFLRRPSTQTVASDMTVWPRLSADGKIK
jgi:hypothetical protein